ncbi:hypothetical protein SDC9_188706 [bioreactor metagenome]|uniref:Uncharacterized protein n=1 Tax=bioreactor metagenome TaxID=1076179 RepID=A0A645HYA9_9ZZZZ
MFDRIVAYQEAVQRRNIRAGRLRVFVRINQLVCDPEDTRFLCKLAVQVRDRLCVISIFDFDNIDFFSVNRIRFIFHRDPQKITGGHNRDVLGKIADQFVVGEAIVAHGTVKNVMIPQIIFE